MKNKIVMKNIHVIATGKPTGIFLSNSGLQYSIMNKVRVNPHNGYHINITNDEEIKDGDWGINLAHNVIVKPTNSKWANSNSNNLKKIILTTDQDLINEGVQSIDDEFLEWFVKNPSCEEIEVDDYKRGGREVLSYIIIIPKEEPKQFCENCKIEISKWGCACGKQIEPKQELNLNCFDCNKSLQDCTCMEDTIDMKQETIEEAAEKCRQFYLQNNMTINQIFEAGAKYQAERMYSEEEVIKLVDGAFHMYASSKRHDAKEWLIEQFKKK